MVMVDIEPDSRGVSANHAVTGRDALGFAIGRQSAAVVGPGAGVDGRPRDWIAGSYTRLLNRWNLPDAQANLWFVGQLGAARLPNAALGTQALWSPAVMADYETTRVYAGTGLHTLQTSGWQHHTAYARTGFSFYEADYEDTQPWFVVEAKREWDHLAGRPSSAKTSWTPMLRLVNRRWFVDAGGNRDGFRLNLMWSP